VTLFPGAWLGKVKADPGHIEQIIMNLVLNAAGRHAARRQAHDPDEQH
jgi:nitrogen-specific signal transduction histidine kinase